MNQVHILQLNKSGQPMAWINREDAATLYAKGKVLWEIGTELVPIVGGVRSPWWRDVLDAADQLNCRVQLALTR